MKKAFSITINSIIWLAVAIGLVIAAGSVLQDEKGMAPWGTGLFVVETGSMQPTVKINNIVIVQRIAAENIKENDILTYYEKGNNLTTHRAVSVDKINGEYYFTTKGDDNPDNDLDQVYYENVVGRVWFRVPGPMNILDFIKSPLFWGVTLPITAGAAIIIVAAFKAMKKKNLDDEPETAGTEDTESESGVMS